jgi:nucleotide-binding universal stress UspA family protein
LEVDHMRRCLVVANQTLGGRELREEIRRRAVEGDSSFYVLVPNTRAAHYHVVPAAGGFVPMPSMGTAYGGPESDEEATEEARERLSRMLANLSELGVKAEGQLGSANPLEAIEQTLMHHEVDEVIVATLPKRVSRWLGSDIPHQVERRFGLPVTTIVSRG